MKGKVVMYNEKKGFGYIEGLEGNETGWNFFVHYKTVPAEMRPLEVDQTVVFEYERGATGPEVTKVKVI